jgi:hypothetical protein
VRNLLSKRGIWLLALAISIGGAALVLAPLSGIPGYELGSALAVGVGLLGGAFGIAAAFEARQHPLASAGATVWSAFAASLVLALLVLIPPLAVSLLFSWAFTRCDPLTAIAFYPLLTLPSAAIASASGLASAWIGRRPVWASLVYLLLVVASLAKTVWPLFDGPQVYAYNHFIGYLPGPLYDELLKIRPGLVWHQVETLWIAAFLVFACWWFLDLQLFRLTRPHWRPLAIAGCVVAAIAIGRIELKAPHRFLQAELGGLQRSEHFELIFPEGKPAEEVSRWIRDLEFRHHQLEAFFGGVHQGPIRVYLYRSPEMKQALVGAAQTQFAKPWRREIHLNDLPFPHPTLKHELAHVMSAPFGPWPFRVTTRFGIWPVMGVIEGIAVAAENPAREFTLHEWAAAMRRKKLAPDIRSLFRLTSFYANPGPRAYTVAGSFIRYLNDTYGTEKLEVLYRHGDFAAAYQRPLDALAREWEGFVDAIPLEPTAVDEAFARFRRPSLFARPCAREVAKLAEQASVWLEQDPTAALKLYRRCSSVEPNEPTFQLGAASALQRLGRSEEARTLLSALASQLQGEPTLRAEVMMALADLAWFRGDLHSAESHLREVIQLKGGAATERAAYIKLAAIDSPTVGPILQSYFQPGSEELKLFLLRVAWDQEPRNAYLNYLLGRRLAQYGAAAPANFYLSQALAENLPASIRRESWRLKVQSEYLAGDCAAVQTDAGMLPDLDAALKAEIGEWKERCAFEQAAFDGALVPQRAFR